MKRIDAPTTAEEAGKRDYEEGLPFNKNPMQYGPNVFISGLWEKGWNEAEKDNKVLVDWGDIARKALEWE